MRKDTNAVAGIYRITRLSDGKVYIGQGQKCSQRWWQHRNGLNNRKHRNPELQAAWLEGGADDFIWELVCQPIGDWDAETLTFLEIEVLRNYREDEVYNRMVPIQAYLGARESTRQRLSEFQSKRFEDPQQLARQKRILDETRNNPEHKARHTEAMRVFYETDEAHQVRVNGGAKASRAWQEREDMRERERERRKALWQDPEYRAKMIAARKAAWDDPEKKAKRVASLKRAWADTPDDKRAVRVENATAWQRSEEGRQFRREQLNQRYDEGRGPRTRKSQKPPEPFDPDDIIL